MSPSEQSLIKCLKDHYGIEVAALTRLSLGADRDTAVYKAQAHNSSYFIKLKRVHSPETLTLIMELLHQAGIPHIIPLVKTAHGQPTQQVGNFTLMVFPFVEGLNGLNQDLTDDQWITLGQVMKRIHEIHVPLEAQARIRREGYSSQWRQTVRALYPRLESEPSGDAIAIKFLSFLKKHAAILHRLVDRAEQLAQKAQNERSPFVLCHSDLHGGNILFGEDTFYIVDWDAPIMAPKERDLMFIGGGVANRWNKPREVVLFYKGYGKTEVNTTLLAYYRHERIIEDIAEYAQAFLLQAGNDEEKLEMYQQFVDMFEPHGVVDIAFKTDEEGGRAC